MTFKKYIRLISIYRYMVMVVILLYTILKYIVVSLKKTGRPNVLQLSFLGTQFQNPGSDLDFNINASKALRKGIIHQILITTLFFFCKHKKRLTGLFCLFSCSPSNTAMPMT